MSAQHTLLALGDLSGMSEDQIKQHIADNYAGTESGFSYGTPSDGEKAALLESLKGFDVLIAYESVGSWGCDSSSWFLLRDKQTGMLRENHGGHCSCYGFEGQWGPEETTFEHIASDRFYLPTGGYDDADAANKDAVKQFAIDAIGSTACDGTGVEP